MRQPVIAIDHVSAVMVALNLMAYGRGLPPEATNRLATMGCVACASAWRAWGAH